MVRPVRAPPAWDSLSGLSSSGSASRPGALAGRDGQAGAPILAVIAGARAGTQPERARLANDTPYIDTLGLTNYQEGSATASQCEQPRRRPTDPRGGPGNWAVEYPAVVAPGDPSLDSEGMTANPWPSSDWMAVLSERGIPAFLMLTLAGGLLFLAGVRGWLAGPRGMNDLAPLVLASTVAATAVVGVRCGPAAPVPALYVWSPRGAHPGGAVPERRPAGWRPRGVRPGGDGSAPH
jgi:hypothetical protein